MRRRRPSALYTVLDEEQLLAGVDLADHPDPLAGRSAGEPSEDWDEWSPDPEDEFFPPPDGPSSGSRRREDAAGPVRRRRWLTLGFICALVVVLAVAREIGAALDTSGTRPGPRPAAGVPAASSPTSGAGASVGGAAVRRVVGPPSRPATGPTSTGSGRTGRRARPDARGDASGAAARRSQTVPAGVVVRARGLQTAAAAGGPTHRVTLAGGPTTGPPTRPRLPRVDPARGSASHPARAVGPSASPVREFGFER